VSKGGRKVGSKNNKLDIKLDLEPLDFLQKRLSDVDAKEIRWGYFDAVYQEVKAGDKRTGLPVAVIALWHEYLQAAGEGGYPKRAFFSRARPDFIAVGKNIAPFIFGQELLGRIKNTQGGIENAFQHRLSTIAKRMCALVVASIDSGNFTKLSDRHVRNKIKNGFPPDILIETGQLRNSLQWMIVSKKAYGTNRKVIGNVSNETVKIVLKQDFNGE